MCMRDRIAHVQMQTVYNHFNECYFPHVERSDNTVFQISCVTCRDKKSTCTTTKTQKQKRLNAYIRIANFAFIFALCVFVYRI